MTKAEIQQVKQRFGIIGNTEALSRAIDVAIQVAPTDLSVLITGESGVGKESFPQIIHQYSRRKHGQIGRSYLNGNIYGAQQCLGISDNTETLLHLLYLRFCHYFLLIFVYCIQL